MSRVKTIATATAAALMLASCSGADTAPISATVTATETVTAQAAPQEAVETVTVTETVTVEPDEPQPMDDAAFHDYMAANPMDEETTAELCEIVGILGVESAAPAALSGVDEADVSVEAMEDHLSEVCPGSSDEGTNFEGTHAFGETITYHDGLELTVSSPEEYWPSDSAAGSAFHDSFVRFTVTVTNGTDAPFDSSWLIVHVQSGLGEGERVFDSGQGIDGDPSSTLLSGRTTEWDIAFGVEAPDDIVMTISPDWEYDPMFYTNAQQKP